MDGCLPEGITQPRMYVLWRREVNQEGSHDLLQHFEVEESTPTEL